MQKSGRSCECTQLIVGKSLSWARPDPQIFVIMGYMCLTVDWPSNNNTDGGKRSIICLARCRTELKLKLPQLRSFFYFARGKSLISPEIISINNKYLGLKTIEEGV
jgi:hypothetical protein